VSPFQDKIHSPDSRILSTSSAVYSCCWLSPGQPFLGQSPVGLMTIFYYLRFETPPTWRARSPYLYLPERRWPRYTPSHWVPFSLPPTTRRDTVEVLEVASTRINSHCLSRPVNPRDVASGRTQQKTPPPTFPLLLHVVNCVLGSTENTVPRCISIGYVA
jgi:hypothetical protein